MPAGDAFLSLMEEDQAPAPKLADHLGPQQRLRAQESANARDKFRANQLEERSTRAQYGTVDRNKIAALKATGALDADFNARAQLDPQWAKEAVAKAYEISGLTPGAKDAESVGSPGPAPRGYMVGKDNQGNPFYTNRSLDELQNESDVTNANRRAQGMPVKGKEASGFHPLPGMHDSGAGAESPGAEDPAAILFGQSLEKARQIAEAPDRDLEQFTRVEEEADSLMKDHVDITSARNTVLERLQDGSYAKKGFTPKDVAGIDKLLISRGYDPIEEPLKDPTMFKPWHASPMKLPGVGADKAMPATILNPNGAKSEMETANTQNSVVLADTASTLNKQTEKELPRTFQYATMSPTALKLQRKARESQLEKAKEPENPLLGRLASDRSKEVGEASIRLKELGPAPSASPTPSATPTVTKPRRSASPDELAQGDRDALSARSLYDAKRKRKRKEPGIYNPFGF